MLTEVIFFLIIVFGLFLVLWQASLLFVAIFGAPTVYAKRKAVIDALKFSGLKKGELIVDLGCGNAGVLIIAAKEFGARGVGVEISPWCYLKAWWNVLINGQIGKINIIYGDFRKAEKYLKKADVIYLYLLNETLKKLEPWFFKSIGRKTRTVSLAFRFPNKKPIKTVNTFNLRKDTLIYYYKK